MNPNFTPIIDTMGSVTHYNISYSLSSNPATPFVFWLFIAVLGLVLLILSFVLKAEQGADMLGLIAPLPILITAWQSLSIDIMGGAGVAAMGDTLILLENHIVYSETLLSLLFGLLFIISLLNIYRLWVSAKVIEQ